ncbi:MAG: restriction endonuclease [Saprospiraceae bacterium]
MNSNETFEQHHDIRYSEEYTRSYDIRYVAEIQHTGLNEFRVLKNPDKYILEKKIQIQFDKWDARFSNQLKRELKEEEKSGAEEQTRIALERLNEIDNLLIHTLDIDDTIDWEVLKDYSNFTVKNPIHGLDDKLASLKKPIEPILEPIPEKPDSNSAEFKPQLSIADKLIKSFKNKKIAQANENYQLALANWNQKANAIKETNKILLERYETEQKDYLERQNKIKEDFKMKEGLWKNEKDKFLQNQKEYNSKIDLLKSRYLEQDEKAVLEYCELVLNNSVYPETFPQSFELDYNPENKILIIEYRLPSIDNFPTLKEVKYIASKNEIKETHLSETEKNKTFDEAIYKITLRTIHEIFEADASNSIDAVSFNGWVNSLNKATGRMENSCIVSIQANKKEFEEIDLSKVDPKACFKNLKGVGSSKLSAITPIQPIMQIDKADKRIVTSKTVEYDSSTNLAAMDWEDFEHLIREVFEKEFSKNGGEVNVTQASKDGGVDAIAFDPDPIRGGKIVIQAKRYTNVVGVSAVRDLYGTVVNEGATKGILVTTADYGPDSYSFAKGKPLTLLNGGNLLHLLEKHGHNARIDIKEAKKLMSEK